ncbi:unnamed protein product [Rodentolepis nana]|uniref:Doublecortin domain-containing protein n=1 Tax=Rodentolepis nana TaxID=102285 RepID=A0A0R3T2P8_RODNA|nr:unnamed protein product [Rodentolepis nana]
MASQVVESQVFPIQLEWIGGRSTFIQSSFSPRNAYICLEDMKEQHIAVPVVIEKMKNLVVFRQDNRMMDKVFEIKDIVQIHCFPTDPNYAIFEINEHDGSARFEVIRAPENESLKVLQDFIFTPHFVNPSAPVLPEQNAESSSPVSDGYETPKPIQTVTNDGTSPNFQVTDGYEGMEVQIIDETINERVTPASRSKDSPGVGETKAEISVKEVDRSRETPSTTSVSSDTLIKSRQPEDFTVELIHESPLRNEKLTQQEPEQQQRPLKTVTIKQRKFAKLVTLKELITEEGINTQNYFDDGKFYVISRKGPKGSFPKSFGLQSSEYSKNQPQNRYVEG